MLASLNHSHIAAIYSLQDVPIEVGPPVRALILELVEGETLAECLARAGSTCANCLPRFLSVAR